MSTGILIGILAAGGASFLSVFLKRLSGLSPNFLTLIRMAGAVPALALFVSIFSEWEIPSYEFWLIVILLKVPLELTLAYVTTKALHLSELSLIGPLASFSSVFLIPIGFVILGELPTLVGLSGVLLIVLGSFFLGGRENKNVGTHIRLENILRDRGVRLALLGAFLAALAISITKFSFQYASPLLAAFYATTILGIVLTPYVFTQRRFQLQSKTKDLTGLCLISSISVALHNIGLSLMPAVYFISVKRLSTIFDVVFGKVIFQEENTQKRFMGAVFMILGVVLIALG